MTNYTAKDILDKYATQVCDTSAVWVNSANKAQIQAKSSFLYNPSKYNENICLWKAPNDWLRLEFDGITAEEAKTVVSETLSNLRIFGVQFCVSYHEGGVSPYINICNIKGLPLTFAKEAKELWVTKFVPQKFINKVDTGNFTFKFTPVLDHGHWKPKYNGAIHKIVSGTHPIEQQNEFPKELVREINKNQKKSLANSNNTKFSDKWVSDFLKNYCCNNKLPEGNRYNVIAKNLAILIAWDSDKDAVIDAYSNTQGTLPSEVYNWVRSSISGKYDQVSAGELAKYIKDNKIPYIIPLSEKQPEEVKVETPDSIIDEIALCMMDKPQKRDKATSLAAHHILSLEHIKTTRSDLKSETWIYREGIYIPDGCTVIREWCDKLFRVTYSTQISNQVIEKIQVKTFVDANTFLQTNYPDLVCCSNGVIKLSTRELLEHTPMFVFFNKIPVVFDKEQKCEVWSNHLKTVLPSKEDQLVIQEWFGYCLYKDYKYEKAMLLNGSGRNGKGKTLEVLKRLLGTNNCSAIELQELTNYNFSREGLVNKYANICGDISATAIKETGKFKMLTGHDQMEVYRKFQKSLPYTNYAKLVFSCNEVPATPDNTKAFFDRWLIIDFPYTFVSQSEYDQTPYDKRVKWKIRDPNIITLLSAPEILSGILNWAIDGLERLHSKKAFSTSATMESIRQTWLMKSDSVAAFCMQHVGKDFNNEVRHDELKEHYLKYCDINNLKTKSDKHFRDYIQNNYPAEFKDKKSRISDSGDYKDAIYDRWFSWKGIRYVAKITEHAQRNMDNFQ